MFHKMPFILLSIILSIAFCGGYIPLGVQSILYALSLSIKSCIIFILPLVVFGLLFKTAVHFANKASKVILLILFAICISNFLSTFCSYTVGHLAYRCDVSLVFPSEENALMPAWNFGLSKWIGNEYAMLAGLLLGIAIARLSASLAQKMSVQLEKIVGVILKAILFSIPFFITGFVVKMHHDQVMTYIFHSYALIFSLIGSALFIYITLAYFIIKRFKAKAAFESIKNIAPAAIAGFGSMSSAAAMPLTILGAEKNAEDPDLARAVIPATVNIHLVGDCFAIPIFAFAVMKSFHVAEPSFIIYSIFACYFVLAKFSVAAVPGGGILVMLPILEQYLGFHSDMLSLMTALYILFDPVITCANIFGNGGFAIAVERFLNRTQIVQIE